MIKKHSLLDKAKMLFMVDIITHTKSFSIIYNIDNG